MRRLIYCRVGMLIVRTHGNGAADDGHKYAATQVQGEGVRSGMRVLPEGPELGRTVNELHSRSDSFLNSEKSAVCVLLCFAGRASQL